MLHLINEKLYAFNHSTGENGQFPGFSHHLEICSANELLRYTDDDTPENGSVDTSEMKKFTPINRKIMSLHSSDEDFFNHPMSMRVAYDQVRDKVVPTVDVRCLHPSCDNRTNLYIIAFPFNGMMAPIPEDPKYRIYRGTLVSSGRSFWYNGHRYRKILYLIIEPNLNLFRPDHKYHCDRIDIKFEAMRVYHDRNDNNRQKADHDTMTVSITNANGDYVMTSDRETLESGIDMDSFSGSGKPLWVTFRFEPRADEGNFKRDRSDNPATKTDGNAYTNVRITTNRHGIRKEIPQRHGGRSGDRKYSNGDKRYNRDNPADTEQQSLDDMIKNAKLMSQTEYRETHSRQKGRPGKKRGRK